MKNLILIFLMLFTFNVSAQTTDSVITDTTNKVYPRFYFENGKVEGIIFNLEQSQKIDNKLSLLELYKSKSVGCDELEKTYKRMVNQLTDQNNILSLKIAKLGQINSNQAQMIGNLNAQIANFQKDSALSKKQFDDLSIINNNLKKTNDKLKFQKIAGFSFAGVSLAGVILLSLHIIK